MPFSKTIIQSFHTLKLHWKLIVISCILVGSFVRFVGLFSLGFEFDMLDTQYRWGKSAWEMGIIGFWRDYPFQWHFDYPPLSLLYEYLIYGLSTIFGGGAGVFVLLLKLVNWFFDLLFVLIVVRLGIKFQPTKPVFTWLVGGLAYFLPSLWFVSGVWGQNDTLMVLITIWCIWILWAKRGWLNLDLQFLNSSNFSLNSQESVITENKFYKWFADPDLWVGVIFAVGFWIKQQPILVLPILLIYFAYNKTWLDFLKWILAIFPFGLYIFLVSRLYSENETFYQNRLLELPISADLLTFIGLNQPYFSNYQMIQHFTILLLITVWLVLLFKLSDFGPWRSFRMWALGFFTVTNLLVIPGLIFNYKRMARVTFATFARGDQIGNGATTFWGIFEINSASEVLFSISSINFNPRLIALLIYILVALVILGLIFWKRGSEFSLLKLEKITSLQISFSQILALMWALSTTYFLFFPNMHSRYLHFGVLYALLLTVVFPFKNKLIRALWFIAVLGLNAFYTLNQLLVYGVNNKEPVWVKDVLNWFSTGGRDINAWQLSSLWLSIFSGVLLGLIIFSHISNEKAKS